MLCGSACGTKLAAFEPRALSIDTFDSLAGGFNVGFRFRRDWCLVQQEAAALRAATTAAATGSAARGDAHVEVRPAVIEVHGTSIH